LARYTRCPVESREILRPVLSYIRRCQKCGREFNKTFSIPGLCGRCSADASALLDIRDSVADLAAQANKPTPTVRPPPGSVPVRREKDLYREQLQKVRLLLQEGDVDAAEMELDQITSIKVDAQAFDLEAQIARARGDSEAAAASLVKAAKMSMNFQRGLVAAEANTGTPIGRQMLDALAKLKTTKPRKLARVLQAEAAHADASGEGGSAFQAHVKRLLSVVSGPDGLGIIRRRIQPSGPSAVALIDELDQRLADHVRRKEAALRQLEAAKNLPDDVDNLVEVPPPSAEELALIKAEKDASARAWAVDRKLEEVASLERRLQELRGIVDELRVKATSKNPKDFDRSFNFAFGVGGFGCVVGPVVALGLGVAWTWRPTSLLWGIALGTPVAAWLGGLACWHLHARRHDKKKWARDVGPHLGALSALAAEARPLHAELAALDPHQEVLSQSWFRALVAGGEEAARLLDASS